MPRLSVPAGLGNIDRAVRGRNTCCFSPHDDRVDQPQPDFGCSGKFQPCSQGLDLKFEVFVFPTRSDPCQLRHFVFILSTNGVKHPHE